MENELKGRYADYYTGDKANGTVERKVRLSLNSIKVNFGTDIARELVAKKQFNLGNTHWFELALIPGEKSADETVKEELKRELIKALYQDLRESYPSLTYAWLLEEADKQLAGAKPTGTPGMYLNNYLGRTGLLKGEAKKEE